MLFFLDWGKKPHTYLYRSYLKSHHQVLSVLFSRYTKPVTPCRCHCFCQLFFFPATSSNTPISIQEREAGRFWEIHIKSIPSSPPPGHGIQKLQSTLAQTKISWVSKLISTRLLIPILTEEMQKHLFLILNFHSLIPNPQRTNLKLYFQIQDQQPRAAMQFSLHCYHPNLFCLALTPSLSPGHCPLPYLQYLVTPSSIHILTYLQYS